VQTHQFTFCDLANQVFCSQFFGELVSVFLVSCSVFVLEAQLVQLAFHKEQVCACGQLEVQHESMAWKTLERSTTTAVSSTAALMISNKLICFTKQTDLLIFQNLLEIVPGMTTMVPGDRWSMKGRSTAIDRSAVCRRDVDWIDSCHGECDSEIDRRRDGDRHGSMPMEDRLHADGWSASMSMSMQMIDTNE